MDKEPLKCGRAWVEIDLDALSYNIKEIRSVIPEECDIMAVVKANAYGHGVEGVAGRLVEEGIKSFAVATVNEGIQLRGYVPNGEILVMGYTQTPDAVCLFNYNLTQLVVDGAHGKALNNAGFKLRVHVAIDTGMHRLGVEPRNFEEIESIFNCENLNVEGTATHLASPDSLEKSDIDFTKAQMDKFLDAVKKLKDKGHCVGKLHAQSSYGIFNYPELKCDYVRPGITMFGVKSQNDVLKVKTELRPMLSLKAVIAQVRWIEAGESVSYGRQYIAEKPVKIATVCIGYGDGLPRQMTGNGGECIVKGKKVPIVGRICMDMIMLDVTDIEHIESGDIATIIGKEGNNVIRGEDIAESSNTITNDLFTGLSVRLPRIYT